MNFRIPNIIYLHGVVLKYQDRKWIQVKHYKGIGSHGRIRYNGIMHKLTMV